MTLDDILAEERTPVEPGRYGVVYVARGPLAGEVMFYDADSGKKSALVYEGCPLLSEGHVVRLSSLRTATGPEARAFVDVFLRPGPGQENN